MFTSFTVLFSTKFVLKTKTHSRPNRFLFACRSFHWREEWQNVIFSDEKLFNSVISSPMRVKRPRGQRTANQYCLNNTQLTNVSVNVWGFAAYNYGVRVYYAGPNFDSPKYLRCIRENLDNANPQLANRILLQDNAAFHTTMEMKRFFRQTGRRVIKVSPQSADLNLVENIWHLAERKLSNHLLTNYVNRPEDLFSIVKTFCEEIPVAMVNKLFDSMPSRIAEVRAKRGSATHY